MNNANEPAYPFPVLHGRGAPSGLTKREAFAMAAMQGLGGCMKWDGAYSELDRRSGSPATDARWVAVAAVRYADALLAELAKAHP